jgi:hypothetical protein
MMLTLLQVSKRLARITGTTRGLSSNPRNSTTSKMIAPPPPLARRRSNGHYAEMRHWPIGKSRGEEVHFVIGLSFSRLEVEVRMHLLKHIDSAPNLNKKDLRRLFDFYKHGMVLGDEPLKLSEYEKVEVNKEGIKIKMPPGTDEPDHLVLHDDFKKIVLPDEKMIWKVIKSFVVRLRARALDRIDALRAESYALDNNLMGSGCPESLQTYNDYLGPKHEARKIQSKLRISNKEVEEYIDWKYKPRKREPMP